MFGANAFGWPYYGEAYAGTTTASPTAVADSDTASLTEAVLTAGVVTAKADSDAFTFNDPAKRNDVDHSKPSRSIATAVSSSDTVAFSEVIVKDFSDTDTAALTDSGDVSDANPAPAPVFDLFTLTSTNTLAVTVSDSDTATVDDEEAAVPTVLALNDSDTATFTEAGSTSAGGVGNALFGVVIAFDDTTFATDPAWTRIDDPAGVA